MKDPDIQILVTGIQTSVDSINTILGLLHNKDVEIKLVFTDPKSEIPPYLYVWKAIEHIDYVKASK